MFGPPGPLYNSISPHRRQPGFRSTTIISSIQSWKLFRGRCYLRTMANNIAKYRSSIIEQYCIVGKSGDLGTPFPPFLKAKFRKILQRLNKSKKLGKILKSKKILDPGEVCRILRGGESPKSIPWETLTDSEWYLGRKILVAKTKMFWEILYLVPRGQITFPNYAEILGCNHPQGIMVK